MVSPSKIAGCVVVFLAAASSACRLAAQSIPRAALEVAAGAVAKLVGSAVFVSGRDVESVLDAEFSTEDQLGAMLRPLIRVEVDREGQRVAATLLDVTRTAVFRPGLGCSLVLEGVLPAGAPEAAAIGGEEEERAASARPWPRGDHDAVEVAPLGVDRAALDAAVDRAFAGYADVGDPRTRAVLVVQHDKILAERYGEGFDAATPQHGWSMSKSVVDALVGIRVHDGALDVDAPSGLQQWLGASDARRLLTIETLLRMSSGLAWQEDYAGLLADPARMLFGVADAAAFAADREQRHGADQVWSYSSGTSNILCRLLRDSFEDDRDYHAFPRRALFDRLGMRSAVFETDPSGTFLGSSMVYASARDWARFGLLYLHDGVQHGERILPEGWVAASTRPTAGASLGRYGRHWWLNHGDPADPEKRVFPGLPRDLFYASGYEGQLLAIVPSQSAVIVRLGCTKLGGTFSDRKFLTDVLAAIAPPVAREITIPLVDFAAASERQVVVDREPGQYLGHPTTVLLGDGTSLLCVYPKGHGRGPIVMKRSDDGGRTWSERLPTPASWATSLEVPTLFSLPRADADGDRLVMFSGLYPIRMATSLDDGDTWSELVPIGPADEPFGGIVAMSSVVALRDGRFLALFHDDGRFLRNAGRQPDGPKFAVYGTTSVDGGASFGAPVELVAHQAVHLCEPGALRSPDGEQLALLLRENSRTRLSCVVFSDDEGQTFTAPRELPAALTGDRHVARYIGDGLLFVTFRDMAPASPTRGDWVGWIGTYDDIVRGTEGRCRLRLADSFHAWDAGYPAVEILGDGTVVATSYGHWVEGEEPFILSVRFAPGELEALR